MEFPYNSNNTSYLSGEEKAAFAKFMASEPVVRMLYTNQASESRKVTRVFYPQGVITKLTAFTPPLKDGSRAYHTPLATKGLKEAKVLWSCESGGGSCTGTEWFAWLGEESSSEMTAIKPSNSGSSAGQLAQLKAKKSVQTFQEQAAKKRGRPKKQ